VIHYIYQSAVIRHAMGYASAVSILLFLVILALTALQRTLLGERGRG
jgi:ABC-type sugar transport system permease subunit